MGGGEGETQTQTLTRKESGFRIRAGRATGRGTWIVREGHDMSWFSQNLLAVLFLQSGIRVCRYTVCFVGYTGGVHRSDLPLPACLPAYPPPPLPSQTFNELSARESIDPGDLLPLQTQLEELESSLMDLEMYEVSLRQFSGAGSWSYFTV